MCYHTKLTAKPSDIEKVAKAKFDEPDIFEPKAEFNGFVNPATPIVRFDDRKKIHMYEWGLIADWVKTEADAKKARMNCLNARIEELPEKASYKNKIGNRCLIAMDGMYEWQWERPDASKSKKNQVPGYQARRFSFFMCRSFYGMAQPGNRYYHLLLYDRYDRR